jgi:hypothetical protein
MFTLSHRARIATAAVVIGAVLAAGGTALAINRSHSTALPRTPYPACTASGLVNWMDTQGNGALGTIYYNLKFTNISGHACTMNGYPGVSAVSLANAQLGSAASRDTAAVHPYVLVNGRSVTAVLGIVEAGNFTPSACHMTYAGGLRVYAPNQTVARIIPFPFEACSKKGPIYLHVGPVKTP